MRPFRQGLLIQCRLHRTARPGARISAAYRSPRGELSRARFLHPPLEEARIARCETGWGNLSTQAPFERRDRHPTPPLIPFASTLPLQGRVRRASARNLHKNPQILGIPDKCPANRPGIFAAWGKSSASNFGRRDCPGGCSTTAGGWRRRRFVPPLSLFQSRARRSPSPGAATSPSFIPGNNNVSIATASDFIAPRLDSNRCYLARTGNWRASGFRAWRLERYFATYPPVWLNQSDSDKG